MPSEKALNMSAKKRKKCFHALKAFDHGNKATTV